MIGLGLHFWQGPGTELTSQVTLSLQTFSGLALNDRVGPHSLVYEEDANHWGKGDHSGARFDLCTVYGHIHQQFISGLPPLSPSVNFRLTSKPFGKPVGVFVAIGDLIQLSSEMTVRIATKSFTSVLPPGPCTMVSLICFQQRVVASRGRLS